MGCIENELIHNFYCFLLTAEPLLILCKFKKYSLNTFQKVSQGWCLSIFFASIPSVPKEDFRSPHTFMLSTEECALQEKVNLILFSFEDARWLSYSSIVLLQGVTCFVSFIKIWNGIYFICIEYCGVKPLQHTEKFRIWFIDSQSMVSAQQHYPLLVRNAHSVAPLQTYWIRNSREGTQQSVF